METINIHVAEPIFGCQVGKQDLIVHSQDKCTGRNCCIHNPSEHPLNKAELNWRSDRRIMERFCEHQVRHPDPDDLWYRINVLNEDPKYAGIHGCDGCCQLITSIKDG